MSSALDKLLLNIVKTEPISDEIDSIEFKPLIQCKSEMSEEDVDIPNDQKLLSEVSALLGNGGNNGGKNLGNSTMGLKVKVETNSSTIPTINFENPFPDSSTVFGAPRVYRNETMTWELKPNQMYDIKRDNGAIRGRHLICDNATYRNNGTKKGVVYWKCCFPNCKARLSTSVQGDELIKLPGKHNHRLDGLDAQILDAKFQLRLATTSAELKTAVDNIKANYPKYVQQKLKTDHLSRSNRRRKRKVINFNLLNFGITPTSTSSSSSSSKPPPPLSLPKKL